jgi:hypothetical protein
LICRATITQSERFGHVYEEGVRGRWAAFDNAITCPEHRTVMAYVGCRLLLSWQDSSLRPFALLFRLVSSLASCCCADFTLHAPRLGRLALVPRHALCAASRRFGSAPHPLRMDVNRRLSPVGVACLSPLLGVSLFGPEATAGRRI